MTVASALIFHFVSLGQGSVSDTTLAMSLFQFQGGFHQPFGDMGELYGTHAHVGFSYAYKTRKNLIFGADFLFFFGNDVKNAESIASDLRLSNGEIVGIDGEFINELIFQRGLTTGFYVGKIFPLLGPNPNSGLEVRLGLNYLEHRTLIELREDDYPPLEGEYRKGYDRKRAGLATYQYVGYRHFSNNRYANFFIGIDFYQGFTTDYRSYNFDDMKVTDGDYLDFLIGLRFGWTIPVYKRYADKFYIN
jgi:hypothetical protein